VNKVQREKTVPRASKEKLVPLVRRETLAIPQFAARITGQTKIKTK
jgi:hypothetical protein